VDWEGLQVIACFGDLLDLFTCSTSPLVGQIRPFMDLKYQSLERLAPTRWLNDELVITGIRSALLLMFATIFLPVPK
jgi:hypothetical protein